MTVKEVRDFFESIRKVKTERDALAAERAEVMRDMSEAKGMDYENPRVMSSSMADLSQTLERIYARCGLLDKKLARTLDRLTWLRKEAYRLIALCPDAMQRILLYDYYLHGKSWREIRRERHYEKTQPFVIRKRAFCEISKRANSSELEKW